MSSAIGIVIDEREQAPRAVAQRVDDDQRQHREQDDHDREDRDHRRHAGDRVDFLLRDLAERLAVAPHRRAEDHEVLHRAAEHDAGDQPDRAGQEAELRRERRTDERAGAGDRREVMAEEDPLVRRHEVAAVVEPLGRRRAARVEPEDLLGDEPRVEAVGDEIGADGGDDEPAALIVSPRASAMYAERAGAEQRRRRSR